MRRFLLTLAALALASCIPDANAQSIGGGGGGGGAPFTGGALSSELGVVDGTCSAPSIYFETDPTTGFALVEVGDLDGGPGVDGGPAPDGGPAGYAVEVCVDGNRAGLVSIGSTPATCSFGNTVLGWDSGGALDLSGDCSADDAIHNTFIGAESGASLVDGMQNTCVGNRSCHDMTTATASTCVGQGACYENLGGTTTCVGFHCNVNADPADGNTGVGYRVLEGTNGSGAQATGNRNVVVGYLSYSNFSTADYGAVLGYRAGAEVTTGDQNTLLGYQAGDSVTTSAGNTFVGYLAGQAYTTQGAASTCVGRTCLTSATGTDNAALGYNAGGGVTSGYSNTMLGHMAGVTVTTGFQNVFIGDDADGTATGTQDAIAIGYGVTAATGIVQIGSATQTAFRMGTVKASGTVAMFATPGAAGNDTITLPTCDVNAQFHQFAVDDTNDSAPAMLCWCRRNADDSTYAWVSIHDNSTACIDP